jgi:Protein of unknown function (DUF3309)
MPIASLVIVVLVVALVVVLLEGLPRLGYHAHGYTPWSILVVVVLVLVVLWLLGYL